VVYGAGEQDGGKELLQRAEQEGEAPSGPGRYADFRRVRQRLVGVGQLPIPKGTGQAV